MKKLITGILLLMSSAVVAQDTTKTDKHSPFTISGYLDVYYNYDVNRPLTNTMPPFLYSYNRVNEVNLNLAYIKAAYNSTRVRANIAFATGTYINANYSAEPGVLKNIYEANIGLKLSSKSNLWLDAGIFPSRIGWESARGTDNQTLSRSIAAENSPYFETGLKLGYTSKSEKWYLAALLLNGWQRIQRVEGNTTPAFGTQVTFKPSSSITLNSSTFIGNDQPDSVKKMRYFHDFYGLFQLSKQWSATLGFDIGAEQKEKGSSDFNIWHTAALIVKYAPSSKTSLAVRAEYFKDKKGVIIATNTPNGFNAWGFSANADYKILNNLIWRTEVRNLVNKDDIFARHDNKLIGHDLAFITSLAFSF